MAADNHLYMALHALKTGVLPEAFDMKEPPDEVLPDAPDEVLPDAPDEALPDTPVAAPTTRKRKASADCRDATANKAPSTQKRKNQK